MTNADRHALVSRFRRAVYERYDFTPFAHQAEWQLAGDGWTLTDLAPAPGSPAVSVLIPSAEFPSDPAKALRTRRLVVPRVGGAARVLADLAAYKTGKSYSMAAHATGYAAIPDAKVEFVGLEYGTSEPEFTYLVDFLCSERGMNMKYTSYQNDKRGGRMRLKLTTGATYEVRSWNQKEALKGARIDAYYYTECYQLPGIECYTTVKQNLRQRDGVAVFGTTPDRPWVAILHDMGHGREPLWHCTCGVHGKVNPFTYDAHSESLDDPARGGLMTRERYAIAWEGKLGSYVGSVFDYQRGQLHFTPNTHPDLFDWDMLIANGLAERDPRTPARSH